MARHVLMPRPSAWDASNQKKLGEAYELLADLALRLHVTNGVIQAVSGVGESTVSGLLKLGRVRAGEAAAADPPVPQQRTRVTVQKLFFGLHSLCHGQFSEELARVAELIDENVPQPLTPGIVSPAGVDYVRRPQDTTLEGLTSNRAVRPLLAITGGRRTGKSTWTRLLGARAEAAGDRIVRVNADGLDAEGLANAVATAVLKKRPVGQVCRIEMLGDYLRELGLVGKATFILENATSMSDGLDRLAPAIRALRDAKDFGIKEDKPLDNVTVIVTTGPPLTTLGGRYASGTAFNPTVSVGTTFFTEAETVGLASRLLRKQALATRAAKVVFDMTAGHPELTHRLCVAAATAEPFPFGDVRQVVRSMLESARLDATTATALGNCDAQGPSVWTWHLEHEGLVLPASQNWRGEIVARLAPALAAKGSEADARALLTEAWQTRLIDRVTER